MKSNNVEDITCEELKQLMDDGRKVVVIDTRQNTAYNIEHISGAINMYYNPTGDSMERMMMLPALPSDAMLVFYCDCIECDPGSTLMASESIDLGYDPSKVRTLSGGYLRWKELNYPVV
jgi:rhodanese-related sulfurtransferase